MDNTLITKDRLDELVRLAKSTPHGYFVELGVYKGGSLKFLAENCPDRYIIGIDTFEGLPPQHWNDREIHKPGEFGDTSYAQVKEFLRENKNVNLIKGLFPSCAEGYQHQPISFVHVDFDFYEGIKAAIDFFFPILLKGGIMVFDDYLWPNCPGVEQALITSGIPYSPTNAEYQAYIIKE